VLVTHQRQYLPACDRLLVLRGGRITAAGTFAELAALELSELHIPAGAHANLTTVDTTSVFTRPEVFHATGWLSKRSELNDDNKSKHVLMPPGSGLQPCIRISIQ